MNFLLVQDSKVFVDMPLLHSVEDVINNFESLPDRNKVVKQKKLLELDRLFVRIP